jgi:serine/threonine-protein kinase
MTTLDFSAKEDSVAAAIAQYLTAKDNGRAIPIADLLRDHPEIAVELREFLEDKNAVGASLSVFRNALKEPDLRTQERMLGDYELVEKVGGNMGIVYRARQQSLPRDVAVKILLRASPADRARFRSEAEAMAQLHHAHIARIIEVSRSDGLPYFSMEWYSGGALSDGKVDYQHHPGAAAALVMKIAVAIHYGHQRGILHRDLKPANILIDEFGEPRVADFGLAMPLREIQDAHGSRAGTPSYMAPEQLTGEVTVATDVYGIGAILYELLTGQAPSSAESLSAILERVRVAEPKAPKQWNSVIDADLDAICCKCLVKDPAARYASAADVAADLERYCQGLPTDARPLGSFGRVAHMIRQARAAGDFQKLGPGLIGQAAFVLAANTSVYVLLRSGAPEFWVWFAVFVSYVPLFAILTRDRWVNRGRHNPVRLHLWSLWSGHAAACIAVFTALRLTAGADYVHGIETGYVACSGLNALAFIIMGSIFVGRQYLLGVAWLIAALAMGMLPSAAPLIYAVLMALCSLVTGLQLNAFQKAHPSTEQ